MPWACGEGNHVGRRHRCSIPPPPRSTSSSDHCAAWRYCPTGTPRCRPVPVTMGSQQHPPGGQGRVDVETAGPALAAAVGVAAVVAALVVVVVSPAGAWTVVAVAVEAVAVAQRGVGEVEAGALHVGPLCLVVMPATQGSPWCSRTTKRASCQWGLTRRSWRKGMRRRAIVASGCPLEAPCSTEHPFLRCVARTHPPTHTRPRRST